MTLLLLSESFANEYGGLLSAALIWLLMIARGLALVKWTLSGFPSHRIRGRSLLEAQRRIVKLSRAGARPRFDHFPRRTDFGNCSRRNAGKYVAAGPWYVALSIEHACCVIPFVHFFSDPNSAACLEETEGSSKKSSFWLKTSLTGYRLFGKRDSLPKQYARAPTE